MPASGVDHHEFGAWQMVPVHVDNGDMQTGSVGIGDMDGDVRGRGLGALGDREGGRVRAGRGVGVRGLHASGGAVVTK